MKKIIILLLFVLSISSCGDDPISKIFKLKAVKNVQVNATDEEIDELKEKAAEYEGLLAEKIETSDKLASVYESLGLQYIYRRNWTLAIDAFEKAIGYGNDKDTVFQKLGAAYANRGKLTSEKKDLLKAENYYKKALELNTGNPDARYGLGLLYYYALGKKDSGFKLIKKITIDIPSYYPARFALGRMFYEDGLNSQSLAVYQSLLNDLNNQKENSLVKEYKKNASQNIDRLIAEGAGK